MPPVQIDPNKLFSVILAHSGASYIELDITPPAFAGNPPGAGGPRPFIASRPGRSVPDLGHSNFRSDRDRIHRTEVLPRRGRRQRELPQIGQFADPRAVVPDRRHLHHQRRQLLDLAECRLRRGFWITTSEVPTAHDWARITKL